MDSEKEKDLEASELKPVPPGDKFCLAFYCDNCKALSEFGAELNHKVDKRTMRICKICCYNLGIVRPGQEPEIWKVKQGQRFKPFIPELIDHVNELNRQK